MARVSNFCVQRLQRMFLVGLCSVIFVLSASAQWRDEKGDKRPVGEVAESIADPVIQRAMEIKRLPCLTLGVIKNGRLVIRKGYGVRSFESDQRPDADTVFYIGSLSKAITAIGVMLLVDQGMLDLDAQVNTYLKHLPPTWRAITLKQFMAHQSGIPQLNKKFPTFDRMLISAETKPLDFTPGTQQEYNNFNYAVIGKVIEAVTGMRYLEYMKRRVFGPLRMDHTGTGIVSKNLAKSSRFIWGRLAPIDYRIKGGLYAIPSGHLQSTLNDLIKLYEAIRTGTLLKPKTYKLMVSRVNPNFSGTLGWFENRIKGISVVTKNGDAQGFHSVMSFVSGKGDAIIILWTSENPHGNGLFRVKNELLSRICHF